MRILIAEDELLERKAMRKFIEDNFSDMEVIGEAENGRKAITLAKTLSPDVIFMDIKMPGINGLEAIEQINGISPSIKFILVSAYDSFNYAKEAMSFGIKEYILKPGKKEEIVKALLRVKKEIAAENVQYQEKVQSEQLIKERFITKIMQNQVSESVVAIRHELYPDMRSGFFIVLHEEDVNDFYHLEKSLVKYITYPYISLQSASNLTVCVMAHESLTKADLLTMIRKIQLDAGNAVYVGIGFPYSHIGQLSKSYHEAYTACFQLSAEENSKYGFIKEGKRDTYINKMISTILHEITKGNSTQANLCFKENIDRFTMTDKENLFIQITNVLLSRDIEMPTTSIQSLTSTQEFQTFIDMCCIKINAYYQSKQIITQAKSYIQCHYQNHMTLEETASFVNLSPNYFSNLFKQELGDTFIDYLTKVRLKKAIELMEEGMYSLKEISFMVGYKDPNYFSRVFKKYYHDSPKRFQKAIFKK